MCIDLLTLALFWVVIPGAVVVPLGIVWADVLDDVKRNGLSSGVCWEVAVLLAMGVALALFVLSL